MPNSPCKNCPIRHGGCHATCEPYQKFWQAKRAAEKKKRLELYYDDTNKSKSYQKGLFPASRR